MKSLIQHLNERVFKSSLSDMLFQPKITEYNRLMIPISSSMYKRIWPDNIRATVFHTTDNEGVKKIAKLEGKKTQISAFFSMQSRYMEVGIATSGGVHAVLEMDADVLLSAKGDVMSYVDKGGRRWITIADLEETSRFTNFSKVLVDLEKMFAALVPKYLTRGEFQDYSTIFQIWHMAKRKVDSKTMSLIIKDYMDGMEKVIKKNIDTFSSAMRSYAKKRSSDYSWDEQIVNNIDVKKMHLFKLPDPDDTMPYPEENDEQDELIAYAASKGWPTKIWDAAIELEIYTRDIDQKELGK
ncbi:MAG: hypothetical protein QGH83_14845 [Candidatus Pacebacteria bacterium]|nr:hypothetical protein [Candidatus Paceibacterota bacterium]